MSRIPAAVPLPIVATFARPATQRSRSDSRDRRRRGHCRRTVGSALVGEWPELAGHRLTILSSLEDAGRFPD